MGNKTFLEKLSDKIWKTKKARFAAAKRMERYYYFSNVSMALTSVSIVGVNLLPFLDGCSNKSSLITILTIIFSVYVLVISLLSTQARFDKKAENYHACGCELTEYNDILQLYIEENRTLNIEEKKEFIRKYNLIIRQYNLNHSSMDYYRGLIEGGEKMKTITFIKNYLQWYFFNWGTVFILIAILIPIISIYIISKLPKLAY